MTAIIVRALTQSRWPAFEELLGARDGCWCMYWRVPRKTFEAPRPSPTRPVMQIKL